MNITQDNIDELNVTLAVEIAPEDYEEKVTKVLKGYRKKAVMDGFRPGKVPFGLISKMHRVPVLIDEINKLLIETISDYIKENKLNVLGDPLPNNKKQEKLDWENQDTFRFHIDVGLAPELEINLSKRIKVPYYKIKIDDTLTNKYIDNYLEQLGQIVSSDQVREHDQIVAKFTETYPEGNPVEKGVFVEEAAISLPAVRDESVKQSLLGKQKGDKILLEIKKVFPDDNDLAEALKINKEKLYHIQPHFLFEIEDIKRFEKAQENQGAYDKLFGKDQVKNHEEFVRKINEIIRQRLDTDSEMLYHTDVKDKLVSFINPSLPEDFLKRWLVSLNKEKYTPEKIEKEFDMFLTDLKWQLIRDKIAEMNEIKIAGEEILEYAKAITREQFRQYGLENMADEQITRYTQEMLKKEDDYNKIVSGILDNKIYNHLKTIIKLDEKEISHEDFNKLYEEKLKKEKENK